MEANRLDEVHTVHCCVCGRERAEDEHWTTPRTTGRPVSHTYCPECLDAATARRQMKSKVRRALKTTPRATL